MPDCKRKLRNFPGQPKPETWSLPMANVSLYFFILALLRTSLDSLALVAFFQGVCEAIRGPTLLDLQDLYKTNLETISFLFLIECIGSLLASFLSKSFFL